ncbi:hypothetical protein BDF14DRAFT_1833058 [Spinellus fusiger]|nr:hypothetical protein BDF14DRAFT_1833058 [Spinellus fusiger]
MQFESLPPEIIAHVLHYLPIKDIVLIEQVCKQLQSLSLWEIGRRIQCYDASMEHWMEHWNVLVSKVHSGQTKAIPTHFDPKSKQVYYSIPMDPIEINTMFDHKRLIHCSVFNNNNEPSSSTPPPPSPTQDGFTLTVEQGMVEGKTVEVEARGEVCEVHAALTRLPTLSHSALMGDPKALLLRGQPPLIPLAPSPYTYKVKVTEMRLPLSHVSVH